MKLKLLILTTLLTCIQSLSAQNITVSGKVIEGSKHEPIEFANVALLSKDSIFIKGVNSDSSGLFAFNDINPDDYMLSVSYIGYTTWQNPIKSSNENVRLDAIILEPSAVSLSEAVVTAQSVINKADRKLITPSETQVKASSNGMDLLQKLQIPRLRVDPINNKINVSGNGEVQLRINGVQVTIAEVIAIRPEDIIRIEYHDDPGVRYGGAAAVVNYITRRKESGGNINGNGSQGITMLGFADDFLSAKANYKKSEFSTNMSWNYRDLDWTRTNAETFVYPDKEVHRQEVGLPTKFKESNVNTALNYSLMEQDKYFLNATFRYNYSDAPNAFSDRNGTLESSDSSTPVTISDHTSGRTTVPALDLYFQRTLKNEQLLIFNAVGTYIDSENSRLYEQSRPGGAAADTYSIYSNISGDKYSLILEGIYERKLGQGKWTSGIKYKQTYANNVYSGTSVDNTSMKQAENYLYTEYQGKKGKLNYMLNLTGSRFYYSQEGKSQEKYMLQPSARIGYNPNDNTYFRYRFNYWGHIPSLGELNDVEQAIDSLQIRRGNPNLESNYSLNNQLSAGYDKGMFGVDFRFEYTYRNKPIMESTYLENGKFIRTTENQKAFHDLHIQATFKFKPWKDHVTFSATPGINRYISMGNNYTHTYTNKFIQFSLDASYKNWVLSAWGGTNWDWFYGETKSEGEQIYMISVGYNKPNYSIMVGSFNPFGGDYRRNDENWDAIAGSKSQVFTDKLAQMIFVKASFNINIGRQFKSGDRRLNNADTDAGIMSGAKK